MNPREIKATIRLPDDQVVALNRASHDIKRLAATAPRGYMRAVRAGMRLQRAFDALTRRRVA